MDMQSSGTDCGSHLGSFSTDKALGAVDFSYSRARLKVMLMRLV